MKKTIVLSGANLFSGGTLSIMQDCARYVDDNLSGTYRIIALVNDVEDFEHCKNIEFLKFNSIRKSYLHRLYYEYIYYNRLSKDLLPYLWLSLNDISSNIQANKRAVYCHNPTPFKRLVFSDIINQTSVFFFTLFYKFLYRINIHKNDYVIVQQNWIKKAFSKMFNLHPSKIIVAPAQVTLSDFNIKHTSSKSDSRQIKFCFPTFPRPFKNIELIGEAVRILIDKGYRNFELTITIDGTENNYSKKMVSKYKHLIQIKFVGLISRKEVFELYGDSDCLVFPSTLETWGLPITEFKLYRKPILAADLEYAHETIGEYDKAIFFNPFKASSLAEKMEAILNGNTKFVDHKAIGIEDPIANDWKELFAILLEE